MILEPGHPVAKTKARPDTLTVATGTTKHKGRLEEWGWALKPSTGKGVGSSVPSNTQIGRARLSRALIFVLSYPCEIRLSSVLNH